MPPVRVTPSEFCHNIGMMANIRKNKYRTDELNRQLDTIVPQNTPRYVEHHTVIK